MIRMAADSSAPTEIRLCRCYKIYADPIGRQIQLPLHAPCSQYRLWTTERQRLSSSAGILDGLCRGFWCTTGGGRIPIVRASGIFARQQHGGRLSPCPGEIGELWRLK